MLPSPNRLAEVVSSIKKATSCRTCGRSPSSALKKADEENSNPKNDGIVDHIHDISSDSSQHYDGALLVSPICGHLFCRDCWAQTAADASTQSANDQMAQCPVCQCCTSVSPQPIIPSLMSGSKSLLSASSHSKSSSGQEGESIENEGQASAMPIPPMSVKDENVKLHLGALLGMLRQLRGVSSQIPTCKNDGAAEDSSEIMVREGADDIITEKGREDACEQEEEEDSEPETEVPGTCLPAMENKNEMRENECLQDKFIGDHEKNACMDEKHTPCMNHQQTGETSTNDLWPQHAIAINGVDVAETPTVHESQLSSLRLSSIKSGERKRDNDIHSLSPLRENLDERQYEAKVCNNPELPENGDGSNQFSQALEQNETEVPCTYFSPLHNNVDERQHELKLCNSQSLSQPTEKSVNICEPGYRTYSPIKQGESEVPGTDLPFGPGRLGFEEQFPESHNDALQGPRRVSTTPVKARQREEEAFKLELSCSPPPSKKRPRVDKEPPSVHKTEVAITTDIRPWNIHSEPMMSQLTCDVKTCPTANYNATTFSSENRETSPIQDRKQKLYVAFDVLDSVEISALKALHEQSFFEVVLDGIHGVPKDPGREDVFVPFPAVLLTHAIEKSGFGSQEHTSTCYRSFTYLKAKALGAVIVDARWAVDTQNAGIVLDCDRYKIVSDLESHRNLMAAKQTGHDTTISRTMQGVESSMMLSRKFDGITFGLLRGAGCNPPFEPNGSKNQSKSQLLNSQLCLETKTMTTLEIESLVGCWGGRLTTDALTQIDFLFVDDWMTLHQVATGLQQNLNSNSDVSRWSIENWRKEELDDLIVSGTLTSDYGEGIEVRIPIIYTKWLEDSICSNSLKSLKSYCCGILCL